MDSNRATPNAYLEHPDWFTVDQNGAPYRAGELYITCVNSAYYDEHLTGVLREIIERYRPDGFADNSWSGLQRDRICYCPNCRRKFRDYADAPLPTTHDWDNPVYRTWIRWNYDRRLEIWDINNRVTKEAGGENCLWIGMNAGEIPAQSKHFRDYKAICERTDLIFLDSQYRHAGQGFQRNAEMGALIHGILGWDKLVPESMAMYGAGQPSFRVASKSEPDARFWALSGFAGGIQPWWHHIGAYHDDRRQYRTAAPLFRWHAEHTDILLNRQPAATIGVVWSQENVDFYGRDRVEQRYGLPWRGMTDALIRARIPYIPVHADHIARDTEQHSLATLVLPNHGALSDEQAASIRQFVNRGGGLVASGESSRYDLDGQPREDFALADLFGAHAVGIHHGSETDERISWDEWGQHTYLRITPERRRWVHGPQTGTEPTDDTPRHPAFEGFVETDIIPFGGRTEVVRPADGARVDLTLVPPFPIYPPETAWMRQPSSTVPALALNESAGGRVAYLAADLDRTFARSRLPDHAQLLANLVRWTASGRIPLSIDGAGFVHAQLYRQPDTLILHLVNLTGHEVGSAPAHEYIPVGPLTVRLHAPKWSDGGAARSLVHGGDIPSHRDGEWLSFTLDRIVDHEVVVVEG
jgi:hypothetical protein